ncbi:hypothetical protein BvCmsKSP013_03232 [Escherichia coli]|nr:hypothetical protein JNE072951_3824 [Escherichia coli]BDQ78266.1 hypothetical protein JNE110611_3905 [Escherichia coli]BDQ83459.1 hypothetical protein PV0671_3770 [Escherichia coli]BDQ89906.1 hypothetical protein JNE071324_4959 [Escherichia coli]BDQ95221.1 hypothetical protein PV0197_4799 [Escherichia coli]
MDQALLDEGYRCYTGEKIDVYFNTAICQHSGNWASYLISNVSRGLCRMKSTSPLWLK